jgi:hypothetical protein
VKKLLQHSVFILIARIPRSFPLLAIEMEHGLSPEGFFAVSIEMP